MALDLGASGILPLGLCGNRRDHAPHIVERSSLGPYRCSADQSTRIPYALERKN